MNEPPGSSLEGIGRAARFAARPAAIGLATAWAAAEAVVLPIVPDVGLGLLALAAPSRAARLFGAVLVGAVAGTLVLAVIATQAPDAARAMLLALPGLDAAVLAEADRALTDQGIAGFAQFGPGPPLKAYSVEWLGNGGDALGLLGGALLNRITRVGPVLLVLAAAGVLFGSWFRRHARLTLVTYTALWVGLYAVLWL
jgi:hypothetical protein